MEALRTLFVLDTNVILSDPDCIWKFGRGDVCIPITVLEELDKFKTFNDSLGYNSRYFMRTLDCVGMGQNLREPIRLQNSEYDCTGHIFVASDYDIIDGMEHSNDNLIISCADECECRYVHEGVDVRDLDDYDVAYSSVILVSNDAAMRVKANAVGVYAEPYYNDYVSGIDSVLSTNDKTVLTDEQCSTLRAGGTVKGKSKENTYFCADTPTQGSVLCYQRLGWLSKVPEEQSVYGISPRNRQQRYLLHALLDESIRMVVVNGVSGAAKTLFALGAGLHLHNEGLYEKLMVSKTIMPVGKDIGYLAGSQEEKTMPWMLPFLDNLDVLVKDHAQELLKQGIIDFGVLIHMRGRSLPRQFLIFDEVQNLSRTEVKTIVTRVGEGTKIVLLGDIDQIDNPYLSKHNNGLVHTMSNMGHLPYVASLNMDIGERSMISRDASKLL